MKKIILLMCMLFEAVSVYAGTPEPYKKHQLLIISENDAFTNPYTDKDYSAGNSIVYTSRETDYNTEGNSSKISWLGKVSLNPKNNVTSWTIGLVNEIYTPDTKSYIPPANEHPYAGIMYLIFGINQRRENSFERIWIDVGMTGTASLAKPIQDLVHSTINADSNSPLPGWHTQIADEFVFNFHYQYTFKHTLLDTKYFGIDYLPTFSLSLGNGSTYIDYNNRIKIGYNLKNDFGVGKVNFGPNLWEKYSSDLSVYLYAGMGIRGVLRNIYIQGNSWEKSRQDIKNLVYYFEGGVSISYKFFRMAYTVTYKSLEFYNQPWGDIYGGINLSFSI